jgi:hypothetical protein
MVTPMEPNKLRSLHRPQRQIAGCWQSTGPPSWRIVAKKTDKVSSYTL